MFSFIGRDPAGSRELVCMGMDASIGEVVDSSMMHLAFPSLTSVAQRPLIILES